MISWIRRHLGWKLFISYLAILLIGIILLAAAVELTLPNAFNRHMAGMFTGTETDPMRGMMSRFGSQAQGQGVLANFRTAVNEALLFAAFVALPLAGLASWFISRRITAPLEQMQGISQQIVNGHYEHRVKLPTNKKPADFDELESFASSFNLMAGALEHTETMRRQLIGDVSHELRTPLTTIKGFMEGLMDGVLPPTAETFQEIHREADRLQHLVSDLQELSRVESQTIPLEFSLADLNNLVNVVAARLRQQYSEKKVSLDTSIPTDLPRLWLSEDRIIQVLTNLVNNALQFTPAGGAVKIQARAVPNFVEIAVADNGIGIPAEHIPHLFTRFYRVDKSRSRSGGGSGIGLAISKHLVEAHGGQIWAESEGVNQGSQFVFTLPLDNPPK